MKLKDLTHCPECGTLWDGEEIPEELREHYSAPYRWSNLIGIETPDYDGISIWQCPDCGTRWDRWSEEKIGEEDERDNN